MHREARYFALKLDLNSSNIENKYTKDFKKNFIFLKINKRRRPSKVQGVGRNRKIDKQGAFIRHLGAPILIENLLLDCD